MLNRWILCLVLLNLLAIRCHARGGSVGSSGKSESWKEDENQKNQIRELRKELFQKRKYDPHAIPKINLTEPLNVTLKLSLIDMSDIDHEKHTLETYAWLHVEWKDEHLAWDSAKYGNLSKLSVRPDEIFRPDITLYNSDGDDGGAMLHKLDHPQALIISDGSTTWIPPIRLRSKCDFNLTDWPNDRHSCRIKFGSWTHSGNEIWLNNKSSTIDLSDFYQNWEWSILETSSEQNRIKYECCPEEYHDVTFRMTIERKSSAIYRYTVHFPMICAILINLVAILLDTKRDGNAKFMLSGLSLLILVLIGFYLGYLLGFGAMGGPKIVIYLGRMILLVACSILWFIVSRILINSAPIPLPSVLSRKLSGGAGSRRSDMMDIQMGNADDEVGHEQLHGKTTISEPGNSSQNLTIIRIGDKVLCVVALVLIVLLC